MKRGAIVSIYIVVIVCIFFGGVITGGHINKTTEYKDSLITDTIHDTIQVPIVDSIAIARLDSLEGELFVANYKLNRIKSYSNIVSNKPNQVKFLNGWIKRVVNE